MMQKKLKLNFFLGIPIATLAGLFYFGLLMFQTNNSTNTNCTQSNSEEDRTHVNSPWQCSN